MTKAVSGLTYSSNEIKICARYLMDFATKQKKEQQNIVIAFIRDSNERRAKEPSNKRTYFLPGVSSVCICEHAFRRLIGMRVKAWRTCMLHAKNGTSPTHGLQGKSRTQQSSAKKERI
jgi:hypothetical protein